MKDIGIYIHIPFCNSKCFYCDFYSKTDCNKELIEEYIDTLCKEILANAELLQERNIKTVYFGGGTPSLIEEKHIIKILDLIQLFGNDIEEITIEANPETLTLEKLKAYRECGINRLSLGLQSANDSTLKKIGRLSSVSKFEQALNNAILVGFTNISTDIIIGLVDESLEDFEHTLDYVLSKQEIKHISAYSLEVHENTKIDFLINNDFVKLPDETVEREMKYLLDKKMDEHGFERYEISNYAKKDYYSKHNLSYWNQVEYLGVGAAAASYINNTRYTNISDINKYIEYLNSGINIKEEIEELDKLDLIKEYIILRLRLKNGINFEDFKLRFKQDIMNLYKQQIENLINKGLLENTGTNLRLTYKGEDVANIVWQEFI